MTYSYDKNKIPYKSCSLNSKMIENLEVCSFYFILFYFGLIFNIKGFKDNYNYGRISSIFSKYPPKISEI